MKRLFVLLAVVLAPVALFAQVADDRDVLLTSDGTLYTIETNVNDGSVPIDVVMFLRLTIQHGNERMQTVVPETLASGINWRPALAYDSESKTLFVFWLKMPNAMSSELMLASYANGRWQPAVSIDSQPFHLRYNLRIGISRRVAQLQKDGSYADVPALLVHAVWWEETGYGEVARYGLFVIEKGTVSSVELHDLSEFAAVPDSAYNVDPNFNREILRHPAIVDTASPDSIDVVFGDMRTNAFNRVNLKPISDGRIHIPIGARPGGPRVPAPMSFSADWSGRIGVIAPGRDGKMLFYNTSKNAISYIMFDGTWSTVKSLPLNEKLSADAAVVALTRMMNAQ
jgi:hypothetical protein